MLQPLGITTEAEAVYLALGPLDAAPVPELRDLTGLPRDPLDRALEELRVLGLAACSSYGVWRALPLLDVVEQLRTQRLSELEQAASAADSLATHLLAQGSSQADGVATLQGREMVVAAHDELVDSARRELLCFDKPPYAVEWSDVSEEGLRSTAEWRALDRGVVTRCVYHPGFAADRLQEMVLFAAQGEQGRVARVPMKLILVDARVAMVPSMRSYNPGHELRASLVRNPLLVEALVFLFQAVWEGALPILRTFTGQVDPRRQVLVSMLMAGSTDSAIAKSLDVNVRSVGRWVAELMDELGVRTRLQLGAALARSS